jgi:hypothetical protein
VLAERRVSARAASTVIDVAKGLRGLSTVSDGDDDDQDDPEPELIAKAASPGSG